jgi:hypothetical protein
MSTRINISVDSGGLLDANRQQAAANRTRNLLQQEQRKVEAKGQAIVAAKRAAAGANDRGQINDYPFTPPKPQEEPAAHRKDQTIVNGVAAKVTYQTTEGDDVNWTVKVELAAVDGETTTEFTYPYRTNAWNASPEPSGLPSSWSEVQQLVAPYIDFSTATPGLFMSAYHFYNGVENPGNGNPSGTYSIARDALPLNSDNNYSRIFALPDGRGGTYIIFVLNRLHRSRIDRVTKTLTGAYSLLSKQQLADPQPWIGSEVFYPVEYSSNPGCTTGAFYNPTSAEITAWEENEAEYLWAGTTSVTANRETVMNIEFSDYAIHLYKVTKAGAVEVPVPSVLDEWIREICPPLQWNQQQIITSNTSVAFDSNFRTPGVTESVVNWSGSHDPAAACTPTVQQETVNTTSIEPFTYPIFSYDEYISSTTAFNPDFASLVFTLGGVSVNPPSAYGPSFALAYNKNLKGLTLQQSYSYEYMEETFFKLRPKQYVAKCVKPGSCPGPLATSNLDITWHQSNQRPPAFAQLAPINSYRPVRKGAFVTPSRLRTGFSIYWVTNWGSNALCRRILSPLGL